MEASYSSRSAFVPHSDFHRSFPLHLSGLSQDEIKQGVDVFDCPAQDEKGVCCEYKEEDAVSSLESDPDPSPSRTDFNVFGELQSPVRASVDRPLRMSQPNEYHYTLEAHYYHHHCRNTHYCCRPYSCGNNYGQVPSSIDPAYLSSCPPPVQLAQREPILPEPPQRPMALLQPLTDALPKEYHQPTCPQYRLQPNNHPSAASPPETPIRGQSIPGRTSSRRTKTSYDPKTSYLLNTLFFETFGHNTKPTKRERTRIQKKTGISSRHLTYWLSNHKRRFKPELEAFRRLVQEGKVTSYDTFIEYCKKNHVPELRYIDTPELIAGGDESKSSKTTDNEDDAATVEESQDTEMMGSIRYTL